jgi:5-methyltetrahydrofolate--homocysteine methyltransferase
MAQQAIQTLSFDQGDWERVTRDWSAWWEGELERPLVVMHGYEAAPEPLPPIHFIGANYPAEMTAEEIVDRIHPHLTCMRYFGDAFPRWLPYFGPGILAGFLGSEVNPTDSTVWFSPSLEVDLSDIRVAYDPENVWWRRVRDLSVAAVRRWGNDMVIGHTDLGGNLDVLASLRTTERLLTDLHDAPEEVDRLVGEITTAWLRYYDETYDIVRETGRGTNPWAPILSPRRCYMLQCDFSAMISPAMFERFVMPDLDACCRALDHGFYHLDGSGQIRHLDLLLSLERLRGIQWIPGDGAPPPHKWLPLLKRIRDGGKLCQLFVSPHGAMEIVRELGGRGFIFEVFGFFNEETARDFLSALHAADPFACRT